jgi:hypothetical protein
MSMRVYKTVVRQHQCEFCGSGETIVLTFKLPTAYGLQGPQYGGPKKISKKSDSHLSLEYSMSMRENLYPRLGTHQVLPQSLQVKLIVNLQKK